FRLPHCCCPKDATGAAHEPGPRSHEASPGRGRVIMATAYESELELEGELEGLGEFEQHEGEQQEWEQDELEQHELAGERDGEEFFGRIARGIGRFARRAAPLLKNIARVAAPMVGTAIGGPFGAILGKVASQALGEEELAQEWEQHELAHE